MLVESLIILFFFSQEHHHENQLLDDKNEADSDGVDYEIKYDQGVDSIHSGGDHHWGQYAVVSSGQMAVPHYTPARVPYDGSFQAAGGGLNNEMRRSTSLDFLAGASMESRGNFPSSTSMENLQMYAGAPDGLAGWSSMAGLSDWTGGLTFSQSNRGNATGESKGKGLGAAVHTESTTDLLALISGRSGAEDGSGVEPNRVRTISQSTEESAEGTPKGDDFNLSPRDNKGRRRSGNGFLGIGGPLMSSSNNPPPPVGGLMHSDGSSAAATVAAPTGMMQSDPYRYSYPIPSEQADMYTSLWRMNAGVAPGSSPPMQYADQMKMMEVPRMAQMATPSAENYL
jgi:hypothetical protein